MSINIMNVPTDDMIHQSIMHFEKYYHAIGKMTLVPSSILVWPRLNPTLFLSIPSIDAQSLVEVKVLQSSLPTFS